MSIKMVLFDLDGTLLPMDMDEFTMGYFKMLAAKAAPHGYELKSLIKVIWHGVSAMVANDGHCTNEEAFWEDFASIYGKEALKDQPIFNEFYANEFQGAKIFCGFNPQAAETVRWIKDQPARNGDNLALRSPQTLSFRPSQPKAASVGPASSPTNSSSTPPMRISAGANPTSTITVKCCAAWICSLRNASWSTTTWAKT